MATARLGLVTEYWPDCLISLKDGLSRASCNRLTELLELVEGRMREQLSSEGTLVRNIGEHILAIPGKRLRPILLLLTSEMCGYTGPRRVQVAAALELLHTATLVHDDVVDYAPLRRGQPSANEIWGNRRAVLVGDFFYARASALIVEDGDIEALGVFANAIRLMAEGELLQLEHSFDPDVTEQHYYRVIERKSAALLSAATELGGILAGVTRAERRMLSEYGRELGLAFQMRDDALDYVVENTQMGKLACADLREGKVTMPLLITLKRAGSDDRAAILSALKNASVTGEEAKNNAVLESEEILTVQRLVSRFRGIEDTNRRAQEHVQRATSAIAPFSEGPAKTALCRAASLAVSRKA